MVDEARTYDALLDALARDVARVAARDPRQTSRDERELFRSALRDCRAKGGEVTYDSADPEQDARAGVLTRDLARLDYAEAMTEEPQPGRYLYRIRVFWNRLRDLAAREGHQL